MKIDKNHPMPQSNGQGAPRKHAFYDMAVGDSFFVDGGNSQSGLVMQARNYGMKSGKKFSARKAEGGVRVWRMA